MKSLGLITIALLNTLPFFAQQWNLHEQLAPDDRKERDYFGTDISVHNELAIMGSYYNNTDGGGYADLTNAGAAYIYEWNDSLGSWEEQQKIAASNRSVNAKFGSSVSIHTNVALVGAPEMLGPNIGQGTVDRAGEAYLFQQQLNGRWEQIAELIPPTRYRNAEFGNAVAIDPPYAAIASFQEAYDENDSNEYHQAGAVYLFKKDATGNWNFHQKLVAADRFILARFGTSIDIENNTLVVGAPNEGLDSTGITPLGAGAVYVFEPNSNDEWIQIDKLVSEDRTERMSFGSAVKLNNQQMIIGAKESLWNEAGDSSVYSAGAAYIYHKDSVGSWKMEQKLTALNRATYDNFGDRVDISGNTCVIGAFERETDEVGLNKLTNAGSAYVFNKQANGRWEEQHNFFPLVRERYDQFGRAVAMNNNYVFTACIGDNGAELGLDTLQGAGSIYVYKTSTPVGISENELASEPFRIFPNPASNDLFINSASYTRIHMMDAQGKYMGEYRIVKGINQIEISHLKSGIYLISEPSSGQHSKLVVRK